MTSRVAFVTGASGGIGSACARALAAAASAVYFVVSGLPIEIKALQSGRPSPSGERP